MNTRTPRSSTGSDSPSGGGSETQGAREQRLAQALRDNLRRRKQAAKKPGGGDPSP